MVLHTILNCKSWYIRATVGRVPYTKVLTIERDSTNYAPLSGYSTISNVLQIGVTYSETLSLQSNLEYRVTHKGCNFNDDCTNFVSVLFQQNVCIATVYLLYLDLQYYLQTDKRVIQTVKVDPTTVSPDLRSFWSSLKSHPLWVSLYLTPFCLI